MRRTNALEIAVGVLLIALGIAFLGNMTGWWQFDVFFAGWWTLFLIVPAVASMIQSGINVGNGILLAIGAVLLVDQQGLLGDYSAWSFIAPVVVIAIGLGLIFRSARGDTIPSGLTSGAGSLSGIFGESTASYGGKPFSGVSTSAIFGAVVLDLRGAIIENDVLVNSFSVFGGTDVFVDPNVNVDLVGTNIFGGSSDERRVTQVSGPVVHVKSFALFGGLTVKS